MDIEETLLNIFLITLSVIIALATLLSEAIIFNAALLLLFFLCAPSLFVILVDVAPPIVWGILRGCVGFLVKYADNRSKRTNKKDQNNHIYDLSKIQEEAYGRR